MSKIILNESEFHKLFEDKAEIVDVVKKNKEVEDYLKKVIKDVLKNDEEAKKIAANNKELDKKIKNVSTDQVTKFLKLLWQRNNFFDSELRN